MTLLLIIFPFILTSPKSKSELSDYYFKNNRTDTAILVREYQDCKMYISSSVNYREKFSSALKSDTIIPTFFKAIINEPLFIHVNAIKEDPVNTNLYMFTIFAYPQRETQTDIIKRILVGASRMKYSVQTTLELNPIRTKIVSIELIKNEIEM